MLAAIVLAIGLAALIAPQQAQASTNGHTQSEAVSWAQSQVGKTLGNGQCVYLITAYYSYLGQTPMYGNANTYGSNSLPSGWSRLSASNAQPGDILVSTSGTYGHVGIVKSVSGSTCTIFNQNYLGQLKVTENSVALSGYNCVIRPDWPDPTPVGSEMSSGAGKTIPDGDYEIVSLTDTAYALDIAGDDVPAPTQANVQIWKRAKSGRAQDVFTVTYLNNGFYRITQKGTGMALDIDGASARQGTNVQMWGSNGSNAQQFSISWIATGGTTNGYRIQAKCSGYSIDVAGGTAANGTNVQQYSNNNTAAQGWVFIPYQPSQSVEEGRYVLTSALSDSVELDVAGNTGDVKNGTNVQVWKNSGCLGQYNSFDVKKLSNGYYKLVHVASGKALDSSGGVTTEGANVQVWTDNGTDAQQWAITKLGDGFLLRPRCSGMVMDVSGGKTSDGANIQQWSYNGSKAQTWYFKQAEHTVSYDANGGENAPKVQTKYYKDTLALSKATPTRDGYEFNGWATSKKQTAEAAYQPGASYTKDADLKLYALWKVDASVSAMQGKVNALAANENPSQADVDAVKGAYAALTAGQQALVTGYKDAVGSAQAKVDAAKTASGSVAKAANTLAVKGKTTTVKYSKLKKKAQTLKASKVLTVKKAKGAVAYKLSSAKKGSKSYKSKFSVNTKTGKFTVKKGLKKGTYKVKVKVTAAGTSNYKKATKTATDTIKVK